MCVDCLKDGFTGKEHESGWQDEDEVTTTFRTIKMVQREMFEAGAKFAIRKWRENELPTERIWCADYDAAVALSLELNKADPLALWLFEWDRENGWFIENWREINKEGNN